MPTRIPIYRDELFARLDKDKAEIKAELKKEMNDLALLILNKLEPCVCEEKIEVSKPKIHIQPMIKKK